MTTTSSTTLPPLLICHITCIFCSYAWSSEKTETSSRPTYSTWRCCTQFRFFFLVCRSQCDANAFSESLCQHCVCLPHIARTQFQIFYELAELRSSEKLHLQHTNISHRINLIPFQSFSSNDRLDPNQLKLNFTYRDGNAHLSTQCHYHILHILQSTSWAISGLQYFLSIVNKHGNSHSERIRHTTHKHRSRYMCVASWQIVGSVLIY